MDFNTENNNQQNCLENTESAYSRDEKSEWVEEAYSVPHDDDIGTYDYKKRKNSDAGCLICVTMFILTVSLLVATLIVIFSPYNRKNGNNIAYEEAEKSDESLSDMQESGLTAGDIVMTPMPIPSVTNRPMTTYDGELPIINDTTNPFPEIISGVQTGVVSVCNYGNVTSLFGQNNIEVQGSGSGFVISSEGYVITNAHVISDAVKVTLILYDDKEVDCEVIGSDVSTDIAVLHFDNSVLNIKPLYLGDSENARVGEFVITVGDPSGRELAGTITFGIISAVDRAVNIDGRINTYIQTDAAMNPGNSGGPLINIRGEVIGVNSAKTVTASYDENGNAISAEGLGFAIPINSVKTIAESLITRGRIERPGIGFTIYPSTEEELYKANLHFGLTVQSIVPNGPADKAGIKVNDILISCDNKYLHENADLTSIIQSHKIGDELTIKLYRNGDTLQDIKLTIGDLNDID